MKLSTTLLQAMTLGIAVTVVSSGCRRDDVKSGTVKHEKKHKQQKDYCPACGMG